MLRLVLLIAAAAALASCGPGPLALQCSPSLVQPAPGARPALLARVAGCPGLVAVAGDTPGTTLYVRRFDLGDISDAQIAALPEVQGGR
jgi:hypothetical protein